MIAVTVVASLGAADVKLQLNFKKHLTSEAEDLHFSFYGDRNEVRKVTIKKDGKKLCTLSLSADPAVLEMQEAVVTCEINGDGIPDLLLLTAADADGDIHRALFVSEDGGYARAEGVDAVNFSISDGNIISEQQLITYLAEDEGHGEPPSRRETVVSVYSLIDGKVVETHRRSVAYFTETDIYLSGVYEYREEFGECVATSEDWLSPEKYQKVRDELQKDFLLDIPR